MTQNTSASTGDRTPADDQSIEEMLISRVAAWEAAPVPKFADACDNLRVFGVYLGTGDTATIPVQCKSWDHRRCAEQHAILELRNLYRVIGDRGTGYYAKVPASEFVPARLSDRRYELAKTEGVVWYRWYRRDDGMVWIVASHPLGGRKAPVEFRPTVRPLKLAAVALRLPGVIRADGSNLARVRPADIEVGDEGVDDDDASDGVESDVDSSDDDDGPKVEWIGTGNEERWENTKRAAAVEAMDRYGVEVNPNHPVTLKGGITPEEWAVCLKAVRYRRG